MRGQTFTLADAEKVLCVSLPTTLNALKSAYRRRSRQVHPDHSVAVDAKEQFQLLSAVYEFAQAQSEWLIAVDGGGASSGPAVCDDGTPLSDLGKGLGPTTNGRPCDGCAGKGFNSYARDKVACADCRVDFCSVAYRCRKCGGDGNFKRGGRVAGSCFACGGGGWISEHRKRRGIFGFAEVVNRCATCGGSRRVADLRAKLTYVKCRQCEGSGELLVFNPVIPKGLLGSRR